jgi:hypothetical protein
MIKILIVLEEEGGVDFRAYSFQISNGSENTSPHVGSRLTGASEEPGTDNGITRRSSPVGFDSSCRFPMPQIRRALETQQIFMN